MKNDELVEQSKEIVSGDKFICPECKEEMNCPPGEILDSGLIWVTAKCRCGKTVSGYLGQSYGLSCILDENMNRITLTPDFENPWHPCHYADMHLKHDGTWEDGKWYEWVDAFGYREIARMKFDIEDHFYPQPETIKKEHIIGFREVEST